MGEVAVRQHLGKICWFWLNGYLSKLDSSVGLNDVIAIFVFHNPYSLKNKKMIAQKKNFCAGCVQLLSEMYHPPLYFTAILFFFFF